MKNVLFMNYEANDKAVIGDLHKKHLSCVIQQKPGARLNKGFF